MPLADLLKVQIPGPQPRNLNSVGLQWEPGICMFVACIFLFKKNNLSFQIVEQGRFLEGCAPGRAWKLQSPSPKSHPTYLFIYNLCNSLYNKMVNVKSQQNLFSKVMPKAKKSYSEHPRWLPSDLHFPILRPLWNALPHHVRDGSV